MKVGILTAPFNDEHFETVLNFAQHAGISCLEVMAHSGSKHIDAGKVTAKNAGKILESVTSRGLEMSSLAFYSNFTDPKGGKSAQAYALKVIEAASLLKVNTVCLLAGWPVAGKNKIQTIREVMPGIFKPLLALARKKKINLAMENYFATNLQGLDTFEALMAAIPDDNFGLNYDPSHLYHQECDYLIPVSLYGKRIFHTHAKDCLVDKAKRAQVGIYGEGWWRYVIPGFGNVNWGEYSLHLRMNGYDGVLSIEHEDGTQSREEGFIRGARHLTQFC